jgi:hypothetical protein
MMITLNIQNNESKKDRKVALFSSIGSITLFIVVTILIKFTISPPLPVDLPPLRSDEVIEEFIVERTNVEVTDNGGSAGMEGGEAFAITAPLVTKSDGTKFGKSEGGNVWLDPTRTSPFAFYQFWLNAADADVPRLIRVFTLFSKEQIEEMERAHSEAPHLRILQKAVAEEVTTRVHGADLCALVIEASALLFSKDAIELLTNASDALIAQLPVHEVSATLLAECQNLTDLISVGTENLI